MAYNPYGQAPPYGRPPGFGGFPGQSSTPPSMGPPPGMGAPPGMSAPGTGPPPGVQQANNSQGSRPSGLPSGFQAPPNMPNINFSAPVIRLGTGPSKPTTPVTGGPGRRENQNDPMSAGPGGRPGLGMERDMNQQRQMLRETMMALVPPTRDEVVRTIFIGGITDGVGDDGMEHMLSCAGRLRRWDRATNADGKPCTFGFAQFEDADSLSAAIELLKDVEVPVEKQKPGGNAWEGEEEAEIAKKKLLVFVDDNSRNYIEKWQSSSNEESAEARLQAARSAVAAVVHDLFHPPVYAKPVEADGDVAMQDADGTRGENVEVVNIPLAADDELADIPAEMRETVAQEIAAFRDRSIRRDLERLKREEEMEAAERLRNGAPRASRLASPSASIPSGPAAGTNNIPLGPRDRSVANAPSGPKGHKGVNFVNGSGTNGAASGPVWINRDDEDSEASDEELERRRLAKRDAELEKQYLDQERRWLNRERSRTAAVQRERERDDEEQNGLKATQDKMAQRLREWDDDAETSRKAEEYYSDRSQWIRNRAAFRSREAAADEQDRLEEDRERQREMVQKEEARGMADSFLDRQAEELGSRPSRLGTGTQQPFKLSLGAAAQQQKAQKATSNRRTVAEVEGLLEDEEETEAQSKRTLVPIKFDPSAVSGMSEEEREQAIKDLAAEIPVDKEGLWKWDVKWEHVDDAIIQEKLQPFVEKKIVEYLGVQEQLLVEVVEEHIRKRGSPQELVEQLEGALDEEAEVLVKKLWRMVIFFSESEKRGLSA